MKAFIKKIIIKINNFIYPKCKKCNTELTNYPIGGSKPGYICMNESCK